MKRLFGALAVAALLMTVTAPAAAGKTTRITFDGLSVYDSTITEGEYMSDGSVLSARGAVYLYLDSGSPYIAGPDTVVINYDLDLATGAGELWGTDRIEPIAHPGGAFDCVWHGTFVEFLWTGKIVCHGEGSLDGYQLRGLLLAEPGGDVAHLPGFVFYPGR
jgi:hypothetical protein